MTPLRNGIKLPRRIYVASSWRNEFQPVIVHSLRTAGHEVYDFREPEPGNKGFAWSAIDPDWLGWEPKEYARLIETHPVAREGFNLDKRALDWCDTCVLILPCGRSAHLEAGYCAGQGKQVIFYLRPEKFEPELMYLLGSGFAFDHESLLEQLAKPITPAPSVGVQEGEWKPDKKTMEMLAKGVAIFAPDLVAQLVARWYASRERQDQRLQEFLAVLNATPSKEPTP